MNLFVYYSAMALAGGIGLAKGAVYAMILDPAEFGSLNLVIATAAFLVYVLSGGLVEAVALRLPGLYGEGRVTVAAALVRRASITFLWPSLLVTAVSAVLLYIVLWPAALIGVLALLVASSVGMLSILLSDSRSRGSLVTFGAFSFVRVLVAFGLGVPGGIAYGVVGVVIGEVVGQIFLGIWIYLGLRHVPIVEACDSLPSSSQLRQEGRSMLTHNLFQVAQQNLDRWLVVAGLGTTALGQYGFAALLMMAASLIHGMLYQQVGPAALRNKAEGLPFAESFHSTRTVALIAASLMMLGGAFVWGVWYVLAPPILAPYGAAFEILPLIAVAAVFQVAQLFDWIIAGSNRTHTLARISVYIAISHALFGLIGIWMAMPLWFYATLTLVNRMSTAMAGLILAKVAVSQSYLSAIECSEKPALSDC